jgi:hypothetical protein
MKLSDHWETYSRTIEEGVQGTALVDVGSRSEAPQTERPLRVEVQVPFITPTAAGFPTREEGEATLFAMEDRLDELMGDAAYVGRLTGGGERRFYFYAADEGGLEAAEAEISAAFPAYTFTFARCPDPEWEQYLEALFPDVRGRRQIENRYLVAQQRAQGDDIERERAVEHRARFPTEDMAKIFAGTIWGTDGLEVRSISAEGDAWVVEFVGEHSLEIDALNKVTCPLASRCEEAGGVYCGWTSPLPPAISAERAAAFWSWLKEQGPELAPRIAEDAVELMPEFNARLCAVCAGLFAEFRTGDEGPTLVVTARGRAGLRRAVEELVDAAPELPGWRVQAFRNPFPLDHLKLVMGEESLEASDVSFQTFEGPQGQLGITLLVTRLTEENRDARGNAALSLMDHAVGERLAMLIDSLAVDPYDPELPDVKPLSELSAVLEGVRMDRATP